jgi:hypothetical protein
MKPFQRLSHGDERTITLQLSGIDTAELLDFLKYVGDHFTECADDHLRKGEHAARAEYIDLAAIAAKHSLEINHQSIFKKASGMKWPPLPPR